MRVERQGNKVLIVLREGNQERWFTIKESEAVELALRLGEVLAEPKKPKFNVGDRVKVTRESIVSEKPADRELTVKDFFSEDAIRVEENNLAWPVDWLEKVEPLKLKMGDRVRVIENVWDKDMNLKGQEFTIKALKPFNTNSAILWGTPCVFDLSWLEKIEEAD